MIKINNLLNIGDKVYIIQVARKTHGTDRTIILLGKVETIAVNDQGTFYEAKPIKCVNIKGFDVSNYSYLHRFRNSDIDTGSFDYGKNFYPVFTEKEKCIKWLKK